jgi:hypothetical protein
MRVHSSQFTAYGILALFMGILLYVTVHAFTRTSGSTGQDMANIQKLRYDAVFLLENHEIIRKE